MKENFQEVQTRSQRLTEGVCGAQVKAQEAITAVQVEAQQRETDIRAIVDMSRATRERVEQVAVGMQSSHGKHIPLPPPFNPEMEFEMKRLRKKWRH